MRDRSKYSKKNRKLFKNLQTKEKFLKTISISIHQNTMNFHPKYKQRFSVISNSPAKPV